MTDAVGVGMSTSIVVTRSFNPMEAILSITFIIILAIIFFILVRKRGKGDKDVEIVLEFPKGEVGNG